MKDRGELTVRIQLSGGPGGTGLMARRLIQAIHAIVRLVDPDALVAEQWESPTAKWGNGLQPVGKGAL